MFSLCNPLICFQTCSSMTLHVKCWGEVKEGSTIETKFWLNQKHACVFFLLIRFSKNKNQMSLCCYTCPLLWQIICLSLVKGLLIMSCYFSHFVKYIMIFIESCSTVCCPITVLWLWDFKICICWCLVLPLLPQYKCALFYNWQLM